MKKLFVVFLLTIACTSIHAATIEFSGTLLSNQTATGPGQAVKLPYPVSKHMCTVTWGGTTPTNTVVSFDCSGDGTNWNSCATVTVTASPTIFQVDKPAILYVRGNYVSKSGGDGTTSVTMSCVSGGI